MLYFVHVIRTVATDNGSGGRVVRKVSSTLFKEDTLPFALYRAARFVLRSKEQDAARAVDPHPDSAELYVTYDIEV